MNLTLFYSWQSDTPAVANRNFLLTVIERAAKELDKTRGIRTIIDRDTQGVAGAVDIAATVFEKIDRCDVFIADVTLIGQVDGSHRWTANPNVLLELGRASKEPGWNRVILLFNTFFGEPALLPFDLVTRKVMLYQMDPADSNRAPVRDEIASKLTAAVKLILKQRLQTGKKAIATPETVIGRRIADEAEATRLVPALTLAGISTAAAWERTPKELQRTLSDYRNLQERLLRVTRDARSLLGVVILRAKRTRWSIGPVMLVSELREVAGPANAVQRAGGNTRVSQSDCPLAGRNNPD